MRRAEKKVAKKRNGSIEFISKSPFFPWSFSWKFRESQERTDRVSEQGPAGLPAAKPKRINARVIEDTTPALPPVQAEGADQSAKPGSVKAETNR